MNDLIENRLGRFVEALDAMRPDDWFDAFARETRENGGSFDIPHGENWPASHMAEISLHEVSGWGSTPADVMLNWHEAARETLKGLSAQRAA